LVIAKHITDIAYRFMVLFFLVLPPSAWYFIKNKGILAKKTLVCSSEPSSAERGAYIFRGSVLWNVQANF
jgi:hypothetical protein